MKQAIQELLSSAIQTLQKQGKIPDGIPIDIHVDAARDKSHGDFASNIAMVLAKSAGLNPKDLAVALVQAIPPTPTIQSIKIAGPGFINFELADTALTKVIPEILTKKNQYGLSDKYQGKTANVEFISSNPTGPLHVGHGRGAAFGAAIADLLAAVGYTVDREYYINDAGRQMAILTTSIWLRYLELFHTPFAFPRNAYQGAYVKEIAKTLQQKYGDKFARDIKEVFKNVPQDEKEDGTGDKEAHIDGLIANAKQLLNPGYEEIFNLGLNTVLADIKEDCAAFGIHYQKWFSEKSLETSHAIQHAISKLDKKNYLYKRDNALWFNSIPLGDDKDRVLVRENGQTTYFASDLAYLLNKIERGYDKIIYVFGADHHGYIPRLQAAAKAYHIDLNKLIIPLVQFAVLYRGKERVQMSTRSGEFVTLRQLREEVGKDACRFFYIMRKAEQHMDFDLELAKSSTKDNPVYYIQYAHARICSVYHRMREQRLKNDENLGLASLDKLTHVFEKELLTALSRYPEVVLKAAEHYEPHLLANYLKDLATALHSYYDASGEKILVEDDTLRNARICLLLATKQVLMNGLTLLGLSAPEKM